MDDLLAKVGSANFTNRSLGLDSECDLAVEGYDPGSVAFVASVRNRLVAEHLGLTEGEVRDRLAAQGSLHRLVDEHPVTSPRSLLPTPSTCEAPLDLTALDGAFVDPPEPWNADLLLERAVPVSFRRRLARRWLRPLGFAAVVVAGWMLVHRLGPNADRVLGTLERLATVLAEHPAGSLLAVFAYALAGSLFIPVTMLATATLSVLGLWPGVPVAWLGGILSATLSHAIGGRLGPRAMAWLPNRLSAALGRLLTRRPFWSVILMRLLPLGNFAVLNTIAGAVKVPRRSFVLGNMVGLLPGLLGLGVVVDRIMTSIRRPSLFNFLVTAGLVGLALGLAFALERRFTPARRSP